MTAPFIPIADVVTNVETADPRASPDSVFTYVDISSVDNTLKVISEPRRLLGRDAPSRARKRIRSGDVLVATTRPYLNAVAIVPETLDGAVCSTGFAVLRADEVIDARYLFLFVQSQAFIRPLAAMVQGALYPAVTDRQVLAQRIPLPDLDDQRHIVAQLFARLDDVEAVRRANGLSAHESIGLRAVTLQRAFGGEAATHWHRPRLGTLLRSPLRTGISGAEAADGIVMGLTLAAVRNGRLDLTRTKRIDVDPTTNRVVREGNFYFVRGNGRLSLVGRAGLAPNSEAPVVFPDLLIEANFDPSRVNPRFFRLVWDSIEVRADIESRARTAAGIYKINLANLAEVRVPMPSVHEQLGIADLLDEQLRAIEAISEALEVQRGAIEALRETVLRQAFGDVAA